MGPVYALFGVLSRCAIWRNFRFARVVSRREIIGPLCDGPNPRATSCRHNGPLFADTSAYDQGAVLEISLQYNGRARFVAEAREHRIVLDQPANDGATDEGMTPAELLLTSLGGCVGQYVAQYLRLRKLPAEGLTIRVTAEPDPQPLRLRDFTVTILAPGLTDRQLRALERTFPAGLVQNAIRFENTVRVTAQPAGAPGRESRNPVSAG